MKISIAFCRWSTIPSAFGAAAVLLLAVSTSSAADGKLAEFPAEFRGTWLLRLTSDDAGKSYKSGDGKPICEVSAKEVKFTRKVAFSDEKLVVKSVSKADAGGVATHSIQFENGVVWKVHELSGSITAIIHDAAGDKLTEKYRITIRKMMK